MATEDKRIQTSQWNQSLETTETHLESKRRAHKIPVLSKTMTHLMTIILVTPRRQTTKILISMELYHSIQGSQKMRCKEKVVGMTLKMILNLQWVLLCQIAERGIHRVTLEIAKIAMNLMILTPIPSNQAMIEGAKIPISLKTMA